MRRRGSLRSIPPRRTVVDVVRPDQPFEGVPIHRPVRAVGGPVADHLDGHSRELGRQKPRVSIDARSASADRRGPAAAAGPTASVRSARHDAFCEGKAGRGDTGGRGAVCRRSPHSGTRASTTPGARRCTAARPASPISVPSCRISWIHVHSDGRLMSAGWPAQATATPAARPRSAAACSQRRLADPAFAGHQHHSAETRTGAAHGLGDGAELASRGR